MHSKYKKHQTEVRLKETYARLKTTVDIAVTETNLEPDNWLSESESTLSDAEKNTLVYNNYIKPYLKTNNFKKNKDNIEFYDESGVKYTLSGSWTSEMHIYIHNIALLKVDIDGDKGKNQDGIDIFYFMFKAKNRGHWGAKFSQNQCFTPYVCGTGGTFENYKKDAYYNNGTWPACNINRKNNNGNYCCADIIRLEGWQIKDDYPFKF